MPKFHAQEDGPPPEDKDAHFSLRSIEIVGVLSFSSAVSQNCPVGRDVMDRLRVEFLTECDDAGVKIGLEALQMRGAISSQRVDELVLLMHGGIDSLSHLARLLLIAWGNVEGVRDAFRFLEAVRGTVTQISPHRLDGLDEAVGEICNAFEIGYETGIERNDGTGIERLTVVSFFERALELAADPISLDKFRNAASNLQLVELVPALARTFPDLASRGMYLKASLLLYLLAQFDGKLEFDSIRRFSSIDGLPSPALFEVVGALRYVRDRQADELLLELLEHDDSAIRWKAADSIQYRKENGF